MEAPAVTLSRALDPEQRLQHALDLAFRYLTRRERTVLEMRRYLEGKRVEQDAIEEALVYLERESYLDDARFARHFSDDKRLLEEWGADRIERRLLTLGVPAALVRDAVELRGRGDELEAAQALLQRRFPALDDDQRERRRAYGVLVRKGYDHELAWEAIRAHASGQEDG